MFLHLPRSVVRLGAVAAVATSLAASPLFTPAAGASTAVRARAVEAVNHPPLAGDVQMSASQDEELYVPLPGRDPDGDAVTFAIVSGPSHGTLSGLYSGPVTWGETPVTYDPVAGFHGTDTFTFRVTDPSGASDVGTVQLQLAPSAPAPVTAAFWIHKVSWGHGLARRFDAAVHLTDGDAILTEHWTFSDGGWSDGAVVYHAFPKAGTYSATLVVTTASGSTATVTRTVRVP